MNKYTIKDISEIGIFVALAIILNLPIFKIHISSDAGSISFCMIPLFIIAIRHSWWKSLIAISIIFSLISCFIGGHGIITYPLDYALAYSGIVVSSLLRNNILKKNRLSYLYLTICVLIAILIRYIFSCLSSMFIYKMNFIASLVYNAPYIFISGAITLIVLLLLLKPLKTINERFKYKEENIKEIQ